MTMRTEPLAYLPALIALALSVFALPSRAQAQLISLCSGTALPGQTPERDCDQACHIGCTRTKKLSGRL
jgi:hypothetical protein